MSMTLNEWVSQLNKESRTFKSKLNKALAECGKLVQQTAKDEIGHYQPQKGPLPGMDGLSYPGWEMLAPSTVAEKTRLGYASDGNDNPLLRTGALRESIAVALFPGGFAVGSTDPVAAYQEFGTSRIPPRPFIHPALFQNLPLIEKRLGSLFIKSVVPRSRAHV